MTSTQCTESCIPFSFSFSLQLVCTSLEELRELISKTEDEMDELESTKKKSVSKKGGISVVGQ